MPCRLWAGVDRVSLVSNMSTWSPGRSVLTIAASQAPVPGDGKTRTGPSVPKTGWWPSKISVARRANPGPRSSIVGRCIARRIRSGTFMGPGSEHRPDHGGVPVPVGSGLAPYPQAGDLLFLPIAHGCDRRDIRIPSRPGGYPMTKASRVPVIGVLLIGVLCPPAPVSAQERPPIAERIAKTYGLDSFGEVEGIHFTFTVDSKELKLSQTWDWEPKKDEVSYDGKDKTGKPLKATYRRSELSSQSAVVKDEVDPAFQNAQYWLLFPLHLSWDGSAKVEDTGTHKLPLGKGSATRVVVTYPSQGGYTPGDIWELFVGTDGRVRQFIWRLGGSAEPTVVASWDGYKKAGPLLLSLEHRGTLNGK